VAGRAGELDPTPDISTGVTGACSKTTTGLFNG
jgi:hypothetical protein